MSNPKWVKLTNVISRMEADLVESYLKAHGITTELIQESYEATTFGFGLGDVQILVPDYQLQEARRLYASAGWDFDATISNEDE